MFCLVGLVGGCFSASPADQSAAPSEESAPCITPEVADTYADQVLQLVNLERAERDLQPVVVDQRLTKLAADYACAMVEGKFFGHRDPNTDHGPGERAIAGKYTFFAVGENLAAGQETPADVMKVWMESPAHREIILDPIWKDVGIAVRTGGEHSVYWVQEFGDPASF